MKDHYEKLIDSTQPLGKMDLEVGRHNFFLLSYFFEMSILLQQFKTTFRLAFPERPEEKLLLLTEKVVNVDKTDGKIRKYAMLGLHNTDMKNGMIFKYDCTMRTRASWKYWFRIFLLITLFLALQCIGMLLYLFCAGKTEDNLKQVTKNSWL